MSKQRRTIQALQSNAPWSSLMTMQQPTQEHLLPLRLRTREQVGHGVRDTIEHPPRALQRLGIRLVHVPTTQVVERQSLPLGFCDLLPHPGKRSLVVLLVLLWTDHRLIISSGVLHQYIGQTTDERISLMG